MGTDEDTEGMTKLGAVVVVVVAVVVAGRVADTGAAGAGDEAGANERGTAVAPIEPTGIGRDTGPELEAEAEAAKKAAFFFDVVLSCRPDCSPRPPDPSSAPASRAARAAFAAASLAFISITFAFASACFAA